MADLASSCSGASPAVDSVRPGEVLLSPRQLEILQHSLGVDWYGRGEMYRNHFCAGGADEDICKELVAMGFMRTFTRSYLPYYNCTVTEEGKAAMLAQSPKPPVLTRSQQRYQRFLKADSGLSFREWLRWYDSKPLLVGREQAGSSTLPTEAKPE